MKSFIVFSLVVVLVLGLTVANEEADCPMVCTMDMREVCGKTDQGDTRTFSNSCALRAFNCHNKETSFSLLHNGRCNSKST